MFYSALEMTYIMSRETLLTHSLFSVLFQICDGRNKKELFFSILFLFYFNCAGTIIATKIDGWGGRPREPDRFEWVVKWPLPL